MVFNMAKAYQCSPTTILSDNIDVFIECINYFNIKSEKEVEQKIAKYGIAPKGRDSILALL